MRFALALALGAVLLPPAVLRAEEPKPRYEVIRLSETLHELRADVGGYVVKVLASVGPDGLLLVDTGQREDVPALLATLGRLGGGTPRIVVNSHHHTEHVAGNLGLDKGPLCEVDAVSNLIFRRFVQPQPLLGTKPAPSTIFAPPW